MTSTRLRSYIVYNLEWMTFMLWQSSVLLSKFGWVSTLSSFEFSMIWNIPEHFLCVQIALLASLLLEHFLSLASQSLSILTTIILPSVGSDSTIVSQMLEVSSFYDQIRFSSGVSLKDILFFFERLSYREKRRQRVVFHLLVLLQNDHNG